MQAEDKHDHDGGMQIAIHAAHSTFFFNLTDFLVYFFFNPTDFNKLQYSSLGQDQLKENI